MNLFLIMSTMSDGNELNKDFKIPHIPLVFSSSTWQTLFGMIFVTYIIYMKARKKESPSKGNK